MGCDLPDPGIKPVSPAAPALQADSLPLSHQGSLIHLEKFKWEFSIIRLKYCHLVLILYLSLPPSWYCAYYGRLRKSFLTRVKWLRVQQLICINRRMKPKALLSRSGGEGPLTVLPVVEKFCVWLHFIRGLSTCHSTTLWYTQNVTKNKFFHLCSLVCITNCFSWESSGLIGDVFSYDWRIICWLSGAVVLNLFEGHTPWGSLKSISPFQMYINNPYLKPLLYFMIEYVRQ